MTVYFKPLENGYCVDHNFNVKKIKPDKEDLNFKPGFYNQMLAFCDMISSNKLTWPGQNIQEAYNSIFLVKEILNSKK